MLGFVNKDEKAQIIVEKVRGIERLLYSSEVDVKVARACEDAKMESLAKENMRRLQRRKDALEALLFELSEEDKGADDA